MARRGTVNTQLPWKEVMEAYYWDKLEAAYEGALAVGTGAGGQGAIIYRQIEGEYLTRKDASQVQINAWLTLEFVEAEVPNAVELQAPITEACDAIARRLDWQHSAPIMMSVLTMEADAPW